MEVAQVLPATAETEQDSTAFEEEARAYLSRGHVLLGKRSNTLAEWHRRYKRLVHRSSGLPPPGPGPVDQVSDWEKLNAPDFDPQSDTQEGDL